MSRSEIDVPQIEEEKETERKDEEESSAMATTKSHNTVDSTLVRKDVAAKTVIRAIKRFISESFEKHSGYLRLPRHKRVPKFMGMGERFISEKLSRYMEAL